MNLLRHLLVGLRSAKKSASFRKAAKTRRMRLEQLELRQMFAADLRSFDGSGNNLLNPDWGSSNEQFSRLAPAEYSDGRSSPAGSERASARQISNLVAASPAEGILDERSLSAFIYAWGQFLDHDITLTNSADPAESFPIAIPIGDQYFDPARTGTKTMDLTRSQYDPSTGISNVRQQINSISAFIDGSMIYGSDQATADSLRSFSGGRLRTSEGNLLPVDSDGMFLAGDIRVNENPELISLHTLFLREHNRVAERLANNHPDWNDEQLFQEARRHVIGQLQAITYNEFLPALLGQDAIAPYRGYNPRVNPTIANEFATAAYRLGHSMLGEDVEFLNNRGEPVRDPIALRDAFFDPSIIKENGIDTILKYLASDVAERTDTRVIDDVRNFLFGPPGSGGLDLAALNIQRGRDHGLADYNATRQAIGLRPVRNFTEITRDVELQNALRAAYGDVNNIDLWVGGLAEDKVPGAAVGPTLRRILADQFSRLRDGDRFFYQRDLSGPVLATVQHTTLADVIRRNTTTHNLQSNVFFFRTAVEGRVFVDLNANGRLDGRETTVFGAQVQLLDVDGNVLATVRTLRDGRYAFHDPGLGQFRIRVVVENTAPTNPRLVAERTVAITKGELITGIDLALRPIAPQNALAPDLASPRRNNT